MGGFEEAVPNQNQDLTSSSSTEKWQVGKDHPGPILTIIKEHGMEEKVMKESMNTTTTIKLTQDPVKYIRQVLPHTYAYMKNYQRESG